MLRRRADGICYTSAPELALWKCLEVEACDDAEVVRSTFQGAEEIWVRLAVGIDNLAGCEYNLAIKSVNAEQGTRRC